MYQSHLKQLKLISQHANTLNLSFIGCKNIKNNTEREHYSPYQIEILTKMGTTYL